MLRVGYGLWLFFRKRNELGISRHAVKTRELPDWAGA